MHNSSIIFRAKTAIGHTVLALLLTIIGHWILREWVDRLADWISERIDPLVARLVTLAMILLVSSALLALYKVWRRRARNAAAGGDRCRQASNLESVEYVGWALIGVLVAQAMSVGFLEHFASLFGPAVAARYPVIAGVGGISLVGATIAALFLQADWRRSAPADAGWHRDPMILRMNQLYLWYIQVLVVALLLAFFVSFVRRSLEAWDVFYPWSAVVSGLAVLLVPAEALFYRRQQNKSLTDLRNEAVQTLALVAAVCAGGLIFLLTNYQGFLATSEVFQRLSFASRVAFFAMPALFCGFVLLGMARFIHAGSNVRVFVSFHHSREAAAAEIEQRFAEQGMSVSRIPFRGDYHHDTLIRSIQEEIRRCDVMVCLPGQKPSFVENEVLVASTLRKFIVFLVGEVEPRLPNTAYYGYPVFKLGQVDAEEYRPVSELILLVAGNWRASLRYFLDSWSRVFKDSKTLVLLAAAYFFGTYLVGVVIASLPGATSSAWNFVSHFHREYVSLLGDWLVIWVWLNMFLLGCAFALLNLIFTRRVLRQETLTGHLTHQVLSDRLGDGKKTKVLLDSLWQRPPLAEHEAAG